MSTLNFIYVPFDSAENTMCFANEANVTTIARHYRAYLNGRANQTTARHVQHPVGPCDFDGISVETSVISVIGHCSPSCATLNSSRVLYDGRATLTAEQLVARLQSDGVPSDFRNFDLVACSGGAPAGQLSNGRLEPEVVMSDPNPGDGRRANSAFVKIGLMPQSATPNMTETVMWTSSFGEGFYRQLRRCGFHQAKVTAYLFPISVHYQDVRQVLDQVVMDPAVQNLMGGRTAGQIFGGEGLNSFKISFG